MIDYRIRDELKGSSSRSHHRFAIITGDDFGFSHGVNRAIIDAHERGVLTSASLMVTADAFDEAVALARTHPRLAIGLHLVLVCGRAALGPAQIPHLADSVGRLSSSPVRAGLRYQFNPAAQRELRLEIRAQLEKFRRTGLRLSHVDGHLHMHMHPVVFRTLVELADAFDIKVIRLPQEELGITLALDRSHMLTKLVWSWVFGRLKRYGERRLEGTGIHFVDRIYGLLATGCITENYLLGLIPQIRAAHVEIYAHPAIAMEGEPTNVPPAAGQAELDALLSGRVRHALASNGFALTNFYDLEATIRQ